MLTEKTTILNQKYENIVSGLYSTIVDKQSTTSKYKGHSETKRAKVYNNKLLIFQLNIHTLYGDSNVNESLNQKTSAKSM